MAAGVGKASLGDNFLTGYIHVHLAYFRVIINILSESSIQTPVPGALQTQTLLWISWRQWMLA